MLKNSTCGADVERTRMECARGSVSRSFGSKVTPYVCALGAIIIIIIESVSPPKAKTEKKNNNTPLHRYRRTRRFTRFAAPQNHNKHRRSFSYCSYKFYTRWRAVVKRRLSLANNNHLIVWNLRFVCFWVLLIHIHIVYDAAIKCSSSSVFVALAVCLRWQ